MIKFFEVEFDNIPRNQSDYDGDVVGEYSICILGMRKPTLEEAAEFCAKDMEIMNYKYVVNVIEIDIEEAKTFFDMSNMDRFPIFGKEV